MTSRAPFETRLGRGWVTFEGDDLSGIVLPGCARPSGSLDEEAPPAVEKLRQELVVYFNGDPAAWPQAPDLAERARTPFLRSVYRVVCGIPPGEKMTYQAVADAAGYPGAARAVGSAMARNPYAPIIPCHRVVPSGGGVGHYGGGSTMKRKLIEMETGDA